MPTWLTVKEAMQHLKISRSRLYQLIRENKITPYRIAGQGDARFSRQELDQLLTPTPKDQDQADS